MKNIHKWIASTGLAAVVGLGTTSCVDTIAFGSAFLEKAQGSSVTQDTVFGSAVYTRQFLNTAYSRQYYGLPYNTDSNGNIPDSASPYLGKIEALTDCWQLHYNATTIYNDYYGGTHTSNYGTRGDVFGYTREWVWQVVRYCWLIIENIDRVPDMDDDEKQYLVAQAKCLIAARYFDAFRHYGGLPLVTGTFTGTESSYELPRATVEETVNFMINLLDEAIDSGALFWAYDGTQTISTYYTNAASETGRWTVAGAMALKCKIWQFAASPLFNDTQGYDGGSSEAEQQHLVWYGGYRSDLWDNLLTACEEFFNALETNGYYQLRQATSDTPEQYRFAYRMSYILESSPEILHSVRVNQSDAFNSSSYMWHSWSENGRNSYTPTQEYVEMFPWSDGTPFDWDETEAAGQLDYMFLKGDTIDGQQTLANIVLTRDPRLYETVRVNGLPKMLSWDSGVMSGMPYECWVGGYDAGTNSLNETGNFATGYDNMKYYLGSEYQRQYTQWVALRLSDLYLTYAEALLQARNDFQGCIDLIDVVRARVGLGGLVECNPDKNLLSDKDALLEELLRERVCELGMEDARYFDLVRYKRADRFETPLHGLLIYRLDADGNRTQTQWYEGDYGSGALQPTHFEYEKFQLANRARSWWTYGFDTKWYLSPFPLSEINKDYGLVQNPGW